jgi:hypothetical protein
MAHDPEQFEDLESHSPPLLNEQQEANFARWIESELAWLERRFEHLAPPFAGRLSKALLGRSAGGAGPAPSDLE